MGTKDLLEMNKHSKELTESGVQILMNHMVK